MGLERYRKAGGYFIAVCSDCGDRVGPIEYGPNADESRLEQMVREVLLGQGWVWDAGHLSCPPCEAARRRRKQA